MDAFLFIRWKEIVFAPTFMWPRHFKGIKKVYRSFPKLLLHSAACDPPFLRLSAPCNDHKERSYYWPAVICWPVLPCLCTECLSDLARSRFGDGYTVIVRVGGSPPGPEARRGLCPADLLGQRPEGEASQHAAVPAAVHTGSTGHHLQPVHHPPAAARRGGLLRVTDHSRSGKSHRN